MFTKIIVSVIIIGPDGRNAVYDGTNFPTKGETLMNRDVSLAEARYYLKDAELQKHDNMFWRKFMEGVNIAFPSACTLDYRREPIWPADAANLETHPELAELLEMPPEVVGISVTTGLYSSGTFHLTGPRDCRNLILHLTIDQGQSEIPHDLIERIKQQFRPVRDYTSQRDEEFGTVYPAEGFWIIETPDCLRPLLTQCADQLAEEQTKLDAYWANYASNKRHYRQLIEDELSKMLRTHNWGWTPHEDDATLYYLDASGKGVARKVSYSEEDYAQVQELVSTAKAEKWPRH